MSAANASPAKAPAVSALRCLSPTCDGLLAYEVEPDNTLHVDLAWTARVGDGFHYFPCPRCHGKNVVEAVDIPGKRPRHRVTRFEP